jgi:transcriptional regulator with XRE-family HTH domain
VKRLQGLRRVRLERGLSQAQLAERSGLTQARISLLERGDALAQRRTLQRLAATLECPQRDLVGGAN